MSPGSKLEEDVEGLSGSSLQMSFSEEFCPLNKHVAVEWVSWERMTL